MKKIFLLLLIFILSGLFISCAWIRGILDPNVKVVNDENVVITTKKEVNFINTSSEYSTSPTTSYIYHLNDSDVPYINLKNIFEALKGVVHSEAFNYLTISEHELKLFYYISYAQPTIDCILNYLDDTIFVSTTNFFQYYIYSQSNTDYNRKLASAGSQSIGSTETTFNLAKYGFNVVSTKDEGTDVTLLPLSIFSMLFLAPDYYNLYYNGDNLYGVYFLNSSTSDPYYNTIRQGSLENTQKSDDCIISTYNSFMFSLDYLYGLKPDNANYNELIPSNYKNLMLSTDKADNTQGYATFVLKYLDELHSTFQANSLYENHNAKYVVSNLNQLGPRQQEYYDNRSQLNNILNSRFPGASTSNDIYENIPLVRYENSTAIIYLNSFDTAETSEILNPDGTYKPNAYKKDGDALMNLALNGIKQNSNIKEVIIDLTKNGGGNVGALFRILGYVTDEPLPLSSKNTVSNSIGISYLVVDVDDDSDFQNDAYDTYKWFILTSSATFSAANLMTSIAKQLGIATIIGNKSGGGACSLLPIVLVDGTSLALSGYSQSVYFPNNDTSNPSQNIEYGVDVDLFIDKSNFYNDTFLNNLVHNY